MVCQHLAPLEAALARAGIPETFRGRAWSRNCREWVYFACVIDRAVVRERFALPPCVEDYDYRGTHDGSEAGFVCSDCRDGIMGAHPEYASQLRAFSGEAEPG